jgi:TonB family protein
LGAIFISYRRNDSQGEAGRLFDDLVQRFGEDMVFMDVAGIEAGRDFRKAIEESVSKCGVLLVVMGPQWLDAKDENGARRLDDPGDFVRIETASALRRDIPVIPVLVHGAEMPRADQLPENLTDLAYRNCIELTHARWKSDTQLLIEALRRLLADKVGIEKGTGPAPAKVPTAPVNSQPRAVEASGPSRDSRIDPVTLQRVSRELALYVGPIADIFVNRAASSCTSTKDLYLKVAEEINSLAEREKFLLLCAPSRPIPLSDSGSRPVQPRSATGMVGSRAVAAAKEVRSTTAPTAMAMPKMSPPPATRAIPTTTASPTTTAKTKASQRKYLLLVGGAVIVPLLAIVVVVGERLAKPEGHSSQKTPTLPQQTQTAEPAQVNNGAPPAAAEPDAKISRSTPTPAKNESMAPPIQRIRLSPDDAAGLLLEKVVPDYPPLARQAHVVGSVVLDANISKDGAVENLRAVSGHPLLIPAAIDAVKHWRYKPYVQNGQAVPVNTQITVNFSLTGG